MTQSTHNKSFSRQWIALILTTKNEKKQNSTCK